MSQPTPLWDVVVVGAGPAGLLAACRAAHRGHTTLLLEKNRKIGVKILMSGGSRCNLTHHTDRQGIVAAYGRPGKFLHSALAALGPADLRDLLHQAGVPTKVEPTGKVFPASDRAVDVRDALVRMVRQTPAEIRVGMPVRDLTREAGNFRIQLADGAISAARVILTTGGMSYPGCGTVGDGYRWAEQLGHRIVSPTPSLAPVVLADPWPGTLSGLTVEDVQLAVVRNGREVVERSRGSFLFTHFGCSGPAPMNVSRAIARWPVTELTLRCDFWPPQHFDQVRAEVLAHRARYPTRSISAVFRPDLPRRLNNQLLALAGLDGEHTSGAVSRKNLSRAIALLKQVDLRLQGTRGFQKAEVTAGGVALPDVDSSTMQSKRVPGLYFAGEILDLDGPIGGYNFQAAFSTGWLAGMRIGS